ncbi:MAG: hypothetical protein LWX56_12530 [Ignavibacteria bacterium]|nr:hypothetical protein [Ignavibacteria bacterium]
MMENKSLRAIQFLGMVSLLILLLPQFDFFLKLSGADTAGDPDLFRICRVKDFYEKLPDAVTNSAIYPEDSVRSIYFIGDSYLVKNYGSLSLADALSKELQQPVHAVEASAVNPQYFNGTEYLAHATANRDRKNFVIIEIVERNIVDRFADMRKYHAPAASGLGEKSAKEGNGRQESFTTRVDYFLRNNFASRYITEQINTFLFHEFHRIHPDTRVYSLQPPVLFYSEETNRALPGSFYSIHPDSVISLIADNLQIIQNRLKKEFSAECMFVFVPNKYTLYHNFVNLDTYDNFLPRLTEALNRRDVLNADIYSSFIYAKEMLYFRSDTHWNKRGIEICLRAIMDKLPASYKRKN